MTPEEADALPLTQYLVMEVLAARYRTGETHWTFPTKATPAVRALEGHDLVRWKSGIVERTILVWITDAGRELFLAPAYKPPSIEDPDADYGAHHDEDGRCEVDVCPWHRVRS